MRNLRLLRNINLQNREFFDSDKYCIVNVNDCGNSKSTRVQCFVFSCDLKVYRLLIHNNIVEDRSLIVNLRDYIEPKHERINIVECTYLFNYLYIVLSDGHFILILFNDEDIETKYYDLNIDVKYASWSPDINRTTIIDNDDILYILSFSDDGPNILMRIPLQDESEEQNPSVNVGWGSAETQFRGTEGKFSKSKPTEVTIKEISDDFTVNICWKQNSTAFAVTYFCKTSGIRYVKIFDQDGALLNVTKDITGLFSPIDWCSSRNLITCVQQLPNKKVVCFLEQNALRHGDFQIADDIKVLRLCWNNNGSILACHENRKNSSGEIITLWTTSNYKWYQKQCLVFSEDISYFQWDFDVPNRLHVILETGSYRMYEWMFAIDESGRSGDDANAHLVAVINDKQVNITPYRQVCQPPSMPYTTYSAPTSINAVIFPNYQEAPGPAHHHSALLLLSDYKFALMTYECPSEDLYYFNFGDDETEIEFETPLELSTWLWLLPTNLYFSWNRVDGNYFCVSQLDLETKSIVLKNMFKMKSTILAITDYESNAIVHTEDGSLFLYRSHELLPMTFSLLEPCFNLQAINYRMLIALSENRNLYFNENIKWRDIVAFSWKPPFLVLIKMNNQLLITKVDSSSMDIQFSEVQTRQIEPKSYLVTIVDDQVLLETERGNLEVIQPRPFSIFKMEQMLNQPDYYYNVFKMLRKQRINLNVIYDHNPKSFLSNVQQIVKNVTDSMYLSTFIMELVDENVAQNMFPWKYPKEEIFLWLMEEEKITDKVNRICDAMISAIKQIDIKKLINPLIAALVRQGKLEEAADHAIEYDEIDSLCHLTDPVAVYKATLASYNIVSALRIVEHSKLDPSEYLPFIRELEATEENYRKFKICNYLEKYSEALKYLSECPNKFDECVAYIHRHGLYVNALHVFGGKNSSINPTSPEYVQILMIVADHHFKNRMYEEAGVLYEKSKMYGKAFECYVAVGDWLAVSSVLPLMDGKISETEAYKTLYETLLKRGQYVDAAFVAFHYSKNCKLAVDAFLTAKKYCNALNAAKGLRNEGIIEDTINPQLLTEVKNTIEHLQSDRKIIEKYNKRLKALRKEEELFCPKVEQHDSSSSSSSASTTSKSTDSVSSTTSKSSISSTNSEKELRRRERRLWNLKPGNRREMPALIAVIKDLLVTAEKLYPKQIPDLAKALIITDEIESARALNAEYSQFLKFLQETRNEIWPANEVKEEGGFKDISIRCPPDITNSSEVLKLLDYE